MGETRCSPPSRHGSARYGEASRSSPCNTGERRLRIVSSRREAPELAGWPPKPRRRSGSPLRARETFEPSRSTCRRPTTWWSARCTAGSAAGPKRSCFRAACRRASSSACARRFRPGTFRPRSSTATPASAASSAGRASCRAGPCSCCIRTRRATSFPPSPCTCCPTMFRRSAPC